MKAIELLEIYEKEASSNEELFYLWTGIGNNFAKLSN